MFPKEFFCKMKEQKFSCDLQVFPWNGVKRMSRNARRILSCEIYENYVAFVSLHQFAVSNGCFIFPF